MAFGDGQFRSPAWDPVLIISQIIGIQSTFYCFLGLWLFGMDHWVGRVVTLSQVFDAKELSLSTHSGKFTMVAFALNSLTSAVALWLIVKRTKQCLDYSFTCHFIHLICCWLAFGFPTTWTWWLLSVACVTLSTVSSEYLCMRYELRAIPVSISGTRS